jgi:tetratricopeptide (TPR) repeat protein
MKRYLAVIALLATSVAWAQTTPPSQQPGATAGQTTGTQGQTAPATQPAQAPAAGVQVPPEAPIQVPPPTKAPTIQDQAEYQAYVSAIQQQNPQAKISALEGFLRQYSNSVVKIDALDLLIAAYQQAGNAAKMQEAAQRLLQADPNSIRALALLTYFSRAAASAGQGQQFVEKTREYAQRGLEALPKMPRPEGMDEQQYTQLAIGARTVFEGGLGFAALQSKDYPTAQQYLTRAVKAQPNDLENIYQLGLAYLEQNPPNPIGFWYVARAANLAQDPNQKTAIADRYGKAKYRRYHGDVDGWDQIMASAANATAPPPGFSVAPAPSPAEQVAKMMQGKQVKDMSLDEIQLVLTYGNAQQVQQVWSQVQGKPLALGGCKLVSTSGTTLQAGCLYDDTTANPPKADVTVTLTKPLPPRGAPKPGETIDIQGTPQDYTPKATASGQPSNEPFMLTMTDGCLVKNGRCITAAATPPPKPGAGTKKGATSTKKKTG